MGKKVKSEAEKQAEQAKKAERKADLLNILSNTGTDGFSKIKASPKQKEPKKRVEIGASIKNEVKEVRRDLAKKLEKYDNRVANTVRKIIKPKAKSR